MGTPALLEGLPIGEVQRGRGRTISPATFELLVDLTWTNGQLHSNADFVKKETQFNDMILGGPVVVAVASGIMYSGVWHRFRERYQIKTIAALGVEAKFRGPVYPGDTLYVETWLDSARESRTQPGRAVAIFEDRGINQRGETYLEMRRALLIEREEGPNYD